MSKKRHPEKTQSFAYESIQPEDNGTDHGVNHGTDLFDELKYVSRGGLKLAKALDFFDISPEGKVCIDCGASTGGFTDCLLKKGARLVYAIDVGYGQLAWSLRNDARVITMERTNIRYVTPDMLENKPELAVIDLSFISLALVLPVVRKLFIEESTAICLIKPQFEAGKEKVGKKGVVRDPRVHHEVLNAFINNAETSSFKVKDITYSPIKGPKGNIEYLGLISTTGESKKIDVESIVNSSHTELTQ